jgi:hypothetical protein
MTKKMRTTRLLAVLLALGAAGCAGSAVELELVYNKYLLLPFATAEVAGGKLSLGASGLWPLAGGRRYLCWATDSRGARPTTLLGEIKNDWLVVRESQLGVKLSDFDGLLCTIEAQPQPAAPGGVVALKGAPGRVLMFAGESLLAELQPARARFRIEGLRADYSWERLPSLPPGFFYGLYLKGVLPDPSAGLGTGTTHQHLTTAGEERAKSEAAGATGEQLLRVGRLGTASGHAAFAEKIGRNLTGHRKAICAIEAEDGDGLPSVAALVAPEGVMGMSTAAPSAPPADQQPGADGGVKDHR